jgi:hypothetical protein
VGVELCSISLRLYRYKSTGPYCTLGRETKRHYKKFDASQKK